MTGNISHGHDLELTKNAPQSNEIAGIELSHLALALFFPFTFGLFMVEGAPVWALFVAILTGVSAIAAYYMGGGRPAFLSITYVSSALFAWLTGGLASPLLPWMLVIGGGLILCLEKRRLAGAIGVLFVGFLLWMLPEVGALSSSGFIVNFAGFQNLVHLDIFSGISPSRIDTHLGLSLVCALLAIIIDHDITSNFANTRLALQPETEENANIRELDQHIGAILITVDRNGKITHCGGAWEEITGLSAAAARELTFMEFIHADDNVRASKILRKGEGQAESIRLKNKFGSFNPMEAKCVAVDPESGEQHILLRNIWTSSMSTTFASEQEANDVGRNAFLSNMSHDLRTPLNAIIGFSDIMRGEIFGSIGGTRYRDYAHSIHEAGQKMLDMVDDLLDLSSIEGGRIDMLKERFEITPILEGCVRISQERFSDLGIAARYKKAPTSLSISTDRRAFRRLVNTLLHSIAHRALRGSSITLSVASTDPQNHYLDITLKPPVGSPIQRAERLLETKGLAEGRSEKSSPEILEMLVARSLAQILAIDINYISKGKTTINRISLPGAANEDDLNRVVLGANDMITDSTVPDLPAMQTSYNKSVADIAPADVRETIHTLEDELRRTPSINPQKDFDTLRKKAPSGGDKGK